MYIVHVAYTYGGTVSSIEPRIESEEDDEMGYVKYLPKTDA